MTVVLLVVGYLFIAVLVARYSENIDPLTAADYDDHPLLAGFTGLVWPALLVIALPVAFVFAIGWVAKRGIKK